MRPTLRHALYEAERAQVLAVANEPRFAAMPPARIVSMLAAGVTIGAKVGVSALPVLLSSGLGVAVAALATRHTKAPGVLVLVVLAVASLGALRLSA